VKISKKKNKISIHSELPKIAMLPKIKKNFELKKLGK